MMRIFLRGAFAFAALGAVLTTAFFAVFLAAFFAAGLTAFFIVFPIVVCGPVLCPSADQYPAGINIDNYIFALRL